ncbi:hypothetical protein FAY30_26610 (plasmid) [Bacillus sp. S3]|uniref:hypothetical protein n=1 Tax=Bacillus sp. S3 TaxID=486398 RepID=UPI00118B29A7|nr:hypothetical protein [Bacillus sp. S3]QCJ45513.1 hypothetical protein FAY30_26610 [Bacillus sp. S3]
MGYINPLFNNTAITKTKPPSAVQKKQSDKIRATRSDKTHNIKFPVTPILQMKLKSYLRQAKRMYQIEGKEDITQTKFNTLLLRYGLAHKKILIWNHEYQDTKVYMHTNILEIEYEKEIGGPHGLTIQKNLSDRKVVFHIILSVLRWLEGGGDIEKIL